jgi:hypothetical protein
MYNALFALLAFRFLITTKIQFQKLTFFSHSLPLSFSILALLFHISFIHPISLPPSLSISPSPLPSFLSFRRIHSPRARSSLFFLAAHPSPSLFSFRPIPVLSLLVPTSKSRHHFICHTPLTLLVVPRFSNSRPSLFLVRVFVLLAQLRTHLSSFRSHSFHFLTGISVPPAVPLSLLLILVLFRLSIALRQYPSAHSVLELCCSLSRFHSQPAPLDLLPHYASWCFFSSPPVPSIARSLSRTSVRSLPCSGTSSFSSRTHLPTFSLLFPKYIQHFVVSNYSPSFFPTFTLLFVLTYIFSTFSVFPPFPL